MLGTAAFGEFHKVWVTGVRSSGEPGLFPAAPAAQRTNQRRQLRGRLGWQIHVAEGKIARAKNSPKAEILVW